MIQIVQVVKDIHGSQVRLGCTCGEPIIALYHCEDTQIVFCTHCGEITTRARLLDESTLPAFSGPIQWLNVSDRAECPLVNVSLPVTVKALPGRGPRVRVDLPGLITKISADKCFLRLEADQGPASLLRQQEIDLASECPPLQGRMPGVVEEVLWPHGAQGPAYYKIRLVPLTLEQKNALEEFFQITCGLTFESRVLLLVTHPAFRGLRKRLCDALPKALIKKAASESEFLALAREFQPEFCLLPPLQPLLMALGCRRGQDHPAPPHVILLLPEQSQSALQDALTWGIDDVLYPGSGRDALSRVIQRCRQAQSDIKRQAQAARLASVPPPPTNGDGGVPPQGNGHGSVAAAVVAPPRIQPPRSSITDEDAVRMLCMASETHDMHSSNHLNRIAAYTAAIARQLGLPPARLAALATASKLHDIGKMGVPDAILHKTGTLTADERHVMQEHTRFGYRILQASNSELMRLGAVIALRHHERNDGGGYPDGLVGDKIPLEARIVTVTDVFDALTTQRAYKPAWSNENAIDYLQNQAGAMFSSEVVDAFLGVLPEIERNQLRFLDDFRNVWTERRRHPRLPTPPVPLGIEIAMPEQTFRPFTLSGQIQNMSCGGLKVLLDEVTQDLFTILVSSRRYAKLTCHLPDWGMLDHAFCGVTWIDYYAVPNPTQCLMGISFQKDIPALEGLLRTLDPA